MKVKINGYDCEMTVAEFAEWQAVNAPKTTIIDDPAAPALPLFGDMPTKSEERDFGSKRPRRSLQRAVKIEMPNGEILRFDRICDMITYFPEVRDYSTFYGFHANDIKDFTRKLAYRMYRRLKPQNKFAKFTRFTTDGMQITATMKDGGHRVAVEVAEV